jgi:cyclopropane-fatty-acyl-phospholipid synthase
VDALFDTDRAEGAATAIRHHYDVGNEFYRLWLDSSLTYSCALRVGAGARDDLEAAQRRKLDFHLDAIRADQAERVLDIGCGWGSILGRLATERRVPRSVGLTLSLEQADFARSHRYPGVEIRTENWLSYEPDAPFDGIISIGAFEHFAGPDDSPADRIRLYREFFTRCRRWLTPGGALSLQTIAYGNMSRENANRFIQEEIFPRADLPTLAEIAAAADGIFEVESLSNGRLDYAWTCEQWAGRLRQRRAEAVGLVGADVVARYERYLRLSALGFRMGKICLLRVVLRPFGDGYFAGRGAPRP